MAKKVVFLAASFLIDEQTPRAKFDFINLNSFSNFVFARSVRGVRMVVSTFAFDAVFYDGHNFCTKFDPLHNFFKRRASYHFKAYEFRNLQASDFFNY